MNHKASLTTWHPPAFSLSKVTIAVSKNINRNIIETMFESKRLEGLVASAQVNDGVTVRVGLNILQPIITQLIRYSIFQLVGSWATWAPNWLLC